MNLCVLGSGSSGNAIVLWEDKSALLIDAGLSYKQMMARMPRELDPDMIEGLLITHAHNDHAQSVRRWIENHGLQVWCTAATKEPRPDQTLSKIAEVIEIYPAAWEEIFSNKVFGIGGWHILGLPVHHQSAGAVTYMVRSPLGHKVAMFLETGAVSREMFEAARGAWAYVIEANHDKMSNAIDETRPEFVNERAADGHLDNEQAAELLWNQDGFFIDDKAQAAVFVHVSSDCNDPLLVEKIMIEANIQRPTPLREIHVSQQDKPTPVISKKP